MGLTGINDGQIILLTGERGTGKTNLCRLLANAARSIGWQVAGLITPGVFSDGVKTALLVEDLHSGERQLLARRAPTLQAGSPTPGWIFESHAIQWGNERLKNATPCDLLIIDELGPLELDSQKGWQAGINTIQQGEFRLAVIVIRPKLLERARQLWAAARITTPDQMGNPLTKLNIGIQLDQ